MIWVRDRSLAYFTGCELMESIKKRFDVEGIEIPFPYRTILYKKDMHPSAVPKQEDEGPGTGAEVGAGTGAVTGVGTGGLHFQETSELSGDSDE